MVGRDNKKKVQQLHLREKYTITIKTSNPSEGRLDLVAPKWQEIDSITSSFGSYNFLA